MHILEHVEELLVGWGSSSAMAGKLVPFVTFALILIIAYVADAICRKVLLRVVARFVKYTKVTWDDVLFDQKVMVRASRVVAPLIIYLLIPVAFADHLSGLLYFIQRVCLVYMLIAFLCFFNAFLKAGYEVYSGTEHSQKRPLKGLLQTLQVIVWFIGAIVLIGILIDRSPIALLAGLGASAAVLMLIFKDSITGLVSGVMLSGNDMLKVGDWIEVPKYGANGTVMEVALNTVKVRNWDNTIVTIPPYILVSDSFQNWRGMKESGGRRIKRSLNIDMNTVCFCTPPMLAKFRKMPLVKPYLEQVEKPTNIGVLRAYLLAYVKSLPATSAELPCMVRQLQPTEYGLPLEIYFYTTVKDWIPYEDIQSDLFDHLLAIVPEFGLKVFQVPAGTDLQRLKAVKE